MEERISNGTILVVEDEENVRDVAVQMFESEGFDVLVAADAVTGYQIFESHPEIDLIFSDLILPGGSTGIDLAKKIIASKPGSLIVLATGYGEKGKAIQDSTRGTHNIVFVPKPYDVVKIPNMVRSMLSKRPSFVNFN